jgi:hypothetical protein
MGFEDMDGQAEVSADHTLVFCIQRLSDNRGMGQALAQSLALTFEPHALGLPIVL